MSQLAHDPVFYCLLVTVLAAVTFGMKQMVREFKMERQEHCRHILNPPQTLCMRCSKELT